MEYKNGENNFLLVYYGILPHFYPNKVRFGPALAFT